VFATAIHIYPSLLFAGKVQSLPLVWSPQGESESEWQWHTLAYYDTTTITAVKSFTVQVPGYTTLFFSFVIDAPDK
jgi:hypothetical protein